MNDTLSLDIRQITIKLSEKENLQIEFESFRLEALKSAFDLVNSSTVYNEHTTEIIVEKYIEGRANLRKIILDIAKKNGHLKIKIENFDFLIGEKLLIINY